MPPTFDPYDTPRTAQVDPALPPWGGCPAPRRKIRKPGFFALAGGILAATVGVLAGAAALWALVSWGLWALWHGPVMATFVAAPPLSWGTILGLLLALRLIGWAFLGNISRKG